MQRFKMTGEGGSFGISLPRPRFLSRQGFLVVIVGDTSNDVSVLDSSDLLLRNDRREVFCTESRRSAPSK